MPPLKLVQGNGDVVRVLEDALEAARAGHLEGVIICGISAEGGDWKGAVRDDIVWSWPRLQAIVDTAQHELLVEGIAHWV